MSTALMLEYGRSMSRQRRWTQRFLVLLAGVIVAGYPTCRWGPAAWDRLSLLYWQRQCFNYTPPADRVAYEEDPGAAAKLVSSDPEYSAYRLNRTQNNDPAKAQIAAAYVPKCWAKFGARTGPSFRPWPGSPYGAIVFLHERISPSGNRRLVVVRYFPESSTFTPYFIRGYNYQPDAITPGSLNRPPAISPRLDILDVISASPTVPPKVRMYCGAIDPANASHFTIRYEMWGKSDTLDGYLDDKDDVTIMQRVPPLDAQRRRTASNN